MTDYDVMAYGAVGDGLTNDARAIQAAVDACTAAGGGRVRLPSGHIFCCGWIELKDHVELHVERGAVLQASPRWADYGFEVPVIPTAEQPSGADEDGMRMMISCNRAKDIAITGGGVIDGSSDAYVAEFGQYIHKAKRARPFTIFLLGGQGVTLREITLRNGAVWTLRLSGCEDVLISGVRILNDLKMPNSDGIDLDRCRNVRIVGCHIVCGDDCICLKTCQETAAWGGACENITVTGCTLESTSAALIIGCEVRSPIRNVIFENCVVVSSHRGLAIHLSEGNDIENVIFANITVETRLFEERWWGRAEPIYITAIPWTAQHQIGHVRHVRFSNILCRAENGVQVIGWEPGLIEDVTFDGVRVEIDKWSKWPGGRLDLRPCPGEGLPERANPGFLLRNASGITLRDCQVVWGKDLPEYYSEALETEAVRGLVLENFQGGSAHAG